MGIETLNSAAWAAGFAMAASEDAFEDEASSAAARAAANVRWRPGAAIMVREPQLDRMDWIRGLLGLLGRRAPVSPA